MSRCELLRTYLKNYMKKPEGFNLNLRSRAKETVTIEIPKDTLDSLKKVAVSRNISAEALLKLYTGQDLAKLFADSVLERTVLARYI